MISHENINYCYDAARHKINLQCCVKPRLIRYHGFAYYNEGTSVGVRISTSSASMPLTRPEDWYIDRFHRSLSLSARVHARAFPPSLFRLRLGSRPLNLSALARLSVSLFLSLFRPLSLSTVIHRSSPSSSDHARCETIYAIMQLATWARDSDPHRCAFCDCARYVYHNISLVRQIIDSSPRYSASKQ